MKILITGGSGFIGTHLIKELLQDDSIDKIINLDLKESSIKNSKLVTQSCDIRKDIKVDIINEHFDWCIHLAALCKEPGYDWEEYFDTNHIGTNHVIQLCKRLSIPKITFTSTMMVYNAGEVQRTESSITSPDTAYGISKLLAEKELEKWVNLDANRALKIIRPAVVFGENENANFTRLYKSLKSGFFPYVGKSTTVKSNIYVHELVRFIKFLNKSKSEIVHYNFSFPESSKISHLVATFKTVFGLKSFNPTLPLFLLVPIARVFELLNTLGLKNSIHHRRIEKLFYSTNIYPKAALDEGYKFKHTIQSALEDWKSSEDPNL
ncbi:Nucleoside-diphosphate-sugar epimerase [Ekhidna lutea]|uniref:Nucleoside-diphosphate-sugar epimerase n=1 Tax=Ekhidna lutea TaxID=447679 RepID=A0A239FHI1_EKHLU|nr:NAD(P)-dependent oxidoreductase [Ekhidna lutea]SNS56500.1 Nucleoside-diphosphate-sugar epimerase [Ekhidna lutea]